MSSSKQMVSIKYKEQYLQLIVKQKSAAMTRCQQQTSEFVLIGQNEDELLSISNQQICQPKKFQAKDAIPMNDDDYLLAELNGHFE